MAKRKADPAVAPIRKHIVAAKNKLKKKHAAAKGKAERKKLHANFQVLKKVHAQLGFGLLRNFGIDNG